MVNQLSNHISGKLNDLLEEAIEFDGAEMGFIQLFDREKEVLEVIVQKGFKPDFLEYFKIVRAFDPSACGRAIGSGKPVAIDDVLADVAFEPCEDLIKSAGFRSVKSIPLVAVDEKLIGVLSTHFKQPQYFLQKNQEIPNDHLDEVARFLQYASANIKETELIALLIHRDKVGMEVLYEKYAPVLYYKIGLVIPESYLAEAALQRTFTAVWENIAAFDSNRDKLYPWMVNIALSEAVAIKPAHRSMAEAAHAFTMIELLHFGRYSREEVAKALSIPSDAFNAGLRNAMNKLRS